MIGKIGQVQRGLLSSVGIVVLETHDSRAVSLVVYLVLSGRQKLPVLLGSTPTPNQPNGEETTKPLILRKAAERQTLQTLAKNPDAADA
ncbi:hypothetical protein B0O80DRAFT_444940 [Mortierella sp. GBAus27b]|nr:hypothetical protein B0O80DRAFT_444940 [Mortierella sp. GBAus27b]